MAWTEVIEPLLVEVMRSCRLAHLRRQRRLITDGRRDAAEERRDFRARLREAEDVVDEEQHVLALFVAEVLGAGERRQRDAGACARRLVHLAVDERRLREHRLAGDELGLLHLVPEVVALAGTLTDAGEAGDAAVLLRQVVDELHDEDGLADAGAAEQADLAAAAVGGEQVDDLDAGLERFDLDRLVDELGRTAVDRQVLLGVDRAALVDGITDDVEDAAEDLFADRHHDRRVGVHRLHAADEAVGRVHGDGAHGVLAEVLRDFDGELARRVVLIDVGVLDLERGVDLGQVARAELDVDDRSDDLNDLPLVARAVAVAVGPRSRHVISLSLP